MRTSNSMTVGEAALYSITALTVVFLALISIALFVKIISAVVGAVVKEEVVEKPAPKAEVVKTEVVKTEKREDLSVIVAIIAAISEEMKLAVDKFKIVSIEEKK